MTTTPRATKPQRAVKRNEVSPSSGDTVSGLKTFAMETNDLGFVASLMFVLVPTVFLPLKVAIRNGDTASHERSKQLRKPPEILITTPESLFLLLTSNARERLRSIETVIIDEIHALVGTKRGAHLALSLERLERIVARPLQRIGLSATQRPLEEVARYLGGADKAATKNTKLTKYTKNIFFITKNSFV